MSTTYSVQPGDTLESVARRVYGREGAAEHLRRVNPGLVLPLQSGTNLLTPPLADDPESAEARATDGVTLTFKGYVLRYWSELTLDQSLDSFASCTFTAPFDYNSAEHRELFRPFSYPPVSLAIDGLVVFRGVAVAFDPNADESGSTIRVGCYARAAVLADCNAPISSLPLEFNGENLQSIASRLAADFSLTCVFEESDFTPFETVAIDPEDKVFDFLSKLAKQRGLIISSNRDGNPLFRKPPKPSGRPVRLSSGVGPLVSVSHNFSPQDYFSEVSGITPTTTEVEGARFTARNPHLLDSLRPFTFHADDTQTGDLKTAVDAKLGRMFGNLATYTCTLATDKKPDGELYAPGDGILLEAPEAMIYSPYLFMVRRALLPLNDSSRTTTLELVFPEAFDGSVPEVLPWD